MSLVHGMDIGAVCYPRISITMNHTTQCHKDATPLVTYGVKFGKEKKSLYSN
jgi:hypothetical protein